VNGNLYYNAPQAETMKSIYTVLLVICCLFIPSLSSATSHPKSYGELIFQERFTSVDLAETDRWPQKNHFGDVWHEGLNTELSVWSRFGEKRLSVSIEPVFLHPRDGQEILLRKGYVRLEVANVALQIGRNSLWWGPGRNGALIMSNNAFPFDMIEWKSVTPFGLPSWFSHLGDMEAHFFFTQLEMERKDAAGAFLSGLRLVFYPWKYITVGWSRVTMFGGEGQPGGQLFDFVKRIFIKPNGADSANINELAAIDFRLRFPTKKEGQFFEWYTEYGGEDEAGYFISKHALLTGLEWKQESHRMILEYTDNYIPAYPNVWYNHSTYTDGYTYRGNIIGHQMGGDSRELYLRMESPPEKKWVLGMDFTRDHLHQSDPLPVIKNEWGGDITWSRMDRNMDGGASIRYQVRYVYAKETEPERKALKYASFLLSQTF